MQNWLFELLTYHPEQVAAIRIGLVAVGAALVAAAVGARILRCKDRVLISDRAAVRLFAVALVVSALCGFAVYIVKSLEMQNSLRVKDNSQHDTMEVSDFAAEYIFGKTTIDIKEKVEMPSTVILR